MLGGTLTVVIIGVTWTLTAANDFLFEVITDFKVTATGISSSNHVITTTANTTHLLLYVDTFLKDSDIIDGYSCSDNASNWIIAANNTMPYMDYYKYSVNGTPQLWFQPNTMILGTTLPDRQGGDNNGVITWGSNPTYVSALLGSLTSSAQPSPGAGLEEPTRSVLPATETSDWFKHMDATKLSAFPLQPFVSVMTSGGGITNAQAWVILSLAFILLVTIGTAKAVRGHFIITGIAAGASMGACIALTIFPLWTLVFVIGAVVGGVIAERSPSL